MWHTVRFNRAQAVYELVAVTYNGAQEDVVAFITLALAMTYPSMTPTQLLARTVAQRKAPCVVQGGGRLV